MKKILDLQNRTNVQQQRQANVILIIDQNWKEMESLEFNEACGMSSDNLILSFMIGFCQKELAFILLVPLWIQNAASYLDLQYFKSYFPNSRGVILFLSCSEASVWQGFTSHTGSANSASSWKKIISFFKQQDFDKIFKYLLSNF